MKSVKTWNLICGTDYKATIDRPRKRNERYDTNPTSVSEAAILSSIDVELSMTFLDKLSVALQERRIAYGTS